MSSPEDLTQKLDELLITPELKRWFYDTQAPQRYCKAFGADAEARLRRTIAWRISEKPQLLSPKRVEFQLRRGELVQVGFDKTGRGVIYYVLDFDGCTSDEKVEMMLFGMERNVREVQKKTGQLKLTWIIDLGKFRMGWMTRERLKTSQRVAAVLNDHFPETMGKAFMINVPVVFAGMWKLMLPWLDPVTKAKIEFVPESKKMAKITQLVDKSVLLRAYGGENDSFDPNKNFEELVKEYEMHVVNIDRPYMPNLSVDNNAYNPMTSPSVVSKSTTELTPLLDSQQQQQLDNNSMMMMMMAADTSGGDNANVNNNGDNPNDPQAASNYQEWMEYYQQLYLYQQQMQQYEQQCREYEQYLQQQQQYTQQQQQPLMQQQYPPQPQSPEQPSQPLQPHYQQQQQLLQECPIPGQENSNDPNAVKLYVL